MAVPKKSKKGSKKMSQSQMAKLDAAQDKKMGYKEPFVAGKPGVQMMGEKGSR